jgi:iron-only hydrogenase group A
MIQIEVNGKTISAQNDDTILAAVRRAGLDIPTLCHMDGYPPSGACRICVVEVEGLNGLVPACSAGVREGMKIKTHSQRALEARRIVVELLLANHPDDCNYCVRNNCCELQTLAAQLGVRKRTYVGKREVHKIDASSPSIVRDPNKCILCGRCVRVCEEVQGVAAIDFTKRGSKSQIGTAFEQGLNLSCCINCGQCVVVCPTGALAEHSHIKLVLDALSNPDMFCVVQHAPAISVTIAEELGCAPGSDYDGKMVAALRRIGFDRVFDTSFSADLTIMEEGSELIHRVTNNGVLPMITSCSPGWIKYVETFYPEFRPNVSTCKSPQQMLGAIIKSYFAQRENLDPAKIFSVSIMPCTAKKFEAGRPEMEQNGIPDVDAVLTTRELGQILRMFSIDMDKIDTETADTPFGTRSTAGKIFGASGGVMEAAVRSAYFLITGKELDNLNLEAVRGLSGAKEAHIDINGLNVGVAVVSGLGNASKLLDTVKAGRKDLHFIEVMTCPGGCISGGGQPLRTNTDAVKARMKALYQIDSSGQLRTSHNNPDIKRIYDEFLEKPLGEKSHKLLHTHYSERDVLR